MCVPFVNVSPLHIVQGGDSGGLLRSQHRRRAPGKRKRYLSTWASPPRVSRGALYRPPRARRTLYAWLARRAAQLRQLQLEDIQYAVSSYEDEDTSAAQVTVGSSLHLLVFGLTAAADVFQIMDLTFFEEFIAV